jgi:hypothetical protein
MPEFDFAIIQGPEDAVLIAKPYCDKCAKAKLDIVKTFNADGIDVKKLVSEHKLRCIRVNCEC